MAAVMWYFENHEADRLVTSPPTPPPALLLTLAFSLCRFSVLILCLFCVIPLFAPTYTLSYHLFSVCSGLTSPSPSILLFRASHLFSYPFRTIAALALSLRCISLHHSALRPSCLCDSLCNVKNKCHVKQEGLYCLLKLILLLETVLWFLYGQREREVDMHRYKFAERESSNYCRLRR